MKQEKNIIIFTLNELTKTLYTNYAIIKAEMLTQYPVYLRGKILETLNIHYVKNNNTLNLAFYGNYSFTEYVYINLQTALLTAQDNIFTRARHFVNKSQETSTRFQSIEDKKIYMPNFTDKDKLKIGIQLKIYDIDQTTLDLLNIEAFNLYFKDITNEK